MKKFWKSIDWDLWIYGALAFSPIWGYALLAVYVRYAYP